MSAFNKSVTFGIFNSKGLTLASVEGKEIFLENPIFIYLYHCTCVCTCIELIVLYRSKNYMSKMFQKLLSTLEIYLKIFLFS